MNVTLCPAAVRALRTITSIRARVRSDNHVRTGDVPVATQAAWDVVNALLAANPALADSAELAASLAAHEDADAIRLAVSDDNEHELEGST